MKVENHFPGSFLISDPQLPWILRVLQIISHFTWELPQQLAGVLIAGYLFFRYSLIKQNIFRGVLFFETMSFGPGAGLSLGNIVIHGPDTDDARKQHEYGHCIQSRILGPFYLLLIGIPSFLWAFSLSVGWKYGYFLKTNYDTFFIERNATFLGKKYGRLLATDHGLH